MALNIRVYNFGKKVLLNSNNFKNVSWLIYVIDKTFNIFYSEVKQSNSLDLIVLILSKPI